MGVIDTAFSVLMIGHSLFGQTGPDMLAETLRAGLDRPEIEMRAQIINGAPLRYNWTHSDQAEGVDGRAVLAEGQVTHLILTEAIPLANHLQWSETEAYAQAFAERAASARPEVRIYVQETWHSLRSGTGAEVEYDAGADVAWRDRLAADLPAWEGIAASIAAAGHGASATVIPAGQALGLLSDEIAAGRGGGLAEIADLFDDDIHLNDLGHYFVAMVQYASLTGQSPEGISGVFRNRWGHSLDLPEPALAAELQRIAWRAVQSYHGWADSAQSAGKAVAERQAPRSTGPPAARAQKAARPTGKGPSPAARPAEIGIGLAAIADWSVQHPFLDVMKTARPWIGHLPNRWGGWDTEQLRAAGALDAHGWPLRIPAELASIGTLVLTDLPEAAVSTAGRYRLRFDGTGVIEVGGRAQNRRYGANEVRFDFTPGPGAVEIRLQRSAATDPLRNITLVQERHADLFDAGAVFNTDWTARIGHFAALRFMDWMQTNDSTARRWSDRPLPGDATYAAKGVPVEQMVALANQLRIDPWFNMPHLADDAYVRSFATYVHAHLDPSLTAYVEYSNEVWNWQFAQARWAGEQAEARWGTRDKHVQFYGLRAAQVAAIWGAVFAGEDRRRLRNVISTQTGWLGLEEEALLAPLAQADGAAPPVEMFDTYAISAYFGGLQGAEERRDRVHGWLTESLDRARDSADAQGLTGAARTAHIAAHRFDHAVDLAAGELANGAQSGEIRDSLRDFETRVLPHHAEVARRHGLDLVVYEGGSHLVGIGPQVEDAALTAFFHHLNYTPQMGALYRRLLAIWQAAGGGLFTAYADVYAPTKWGSWGALRHLDDQNPRWEALTEH